MALVWVLVLCGFGYFGGWEHIRPLDWALAGVFLAQDCYDINNKGRNRIPR